ncbi:hypothetical protein GPX89_39150 [Nocardia sp. ET3-3]|uniref:Uncharacterized protein n=1 Tax=Nocardia terrae TaxID=2675851 RepID=A0A7K1V9B5_9NOCA|nr:hypothetical protein [Nocardia terrae]MVU83243.1 hypothetical protein [Nocardia terrae]
MRIPMTALRRAVPGLGVAMVVAAMTAGCGSESTGTAAPAGTTPDRATTTGAATTPPAKSAKSQSGLPSAADGTNVDACANANCEIQVDGPTTISTPGFTRIGGTVKIQDISPLSVTAAGSMFGFPISGSTGVGGTIFLNGLTIKVIAVQGSSAVLRLST